MSRLDSLDLSLALSRSEEADRLEAAQRRLLALRLELAGVLGEGEPGPAVCVLFEGWDAAGKGGTIKRLVAPLDPRHVRVVPFAAPSEIELGHHFLWRFGPALPGLGEMSVLDRSWYGRVLVERVEGLVHEDVWRRAYEEIASFERSLALENTVLIKFWLHLSSREQLKRFKARESDPLKSWKLSQEDWRNRDRRADYEQAVEDMLRWTDLPHAPWHLVEGDSKRYARVKVVETVVTELASALGRPSETAHTSSGTAGRRKAGSP